MGARARLTTILATFGIVAVALPAFSQQVREQILKANPYRDFGGSCVYGRNGELLHQPKGASCPSKEEAPGAAAPGASDPFAGLPPALRSEANALVASHDHVAGHLVELRRAAALNAKASVLALSDEMAKELIDHLAREQTLFEKLAAEHRAH